MGGYMHQLKVYASIYDESNEGWVWVSRNTGVNSRDHISIKFNDKRIYCIGRVLEEFDIKHYNHQPHTIKIEGDDQSVVVMSRFYRDKLDHLERQKKYEFEIKKIRPWNFVIKIYTLTQHPDNYVEIAAWLGIWSLCLGFAGLLISLFSLTCR
jgi:hypothetical protein